MVLKSIILYSSMIANTILLYFYLSVEPSKEYTTESIQSKLNIIYEKDIHSFNDISSDIKFAELLIENERLRHELSLRNNINYNFKNDEYYIYSVLKIRALSLYFMETTNNPSAIEIAVKIIVECNNKIRKYNIDPYDKRLYIDIRDLYKLELEVVPRIIDESK